MPITATAQGKTFTFPDGTTPEQIGQAIDEYFQQSSMPVEPPRQPRQQPVPLSQIDELSPVPEKEIEEGLLSVPAMRPLVELAAAANKSIFQTLDFLGPNNVNAILELSGSDYRVPTFTEELSASGFMEEGAARDVIQSIGALAPAAVGMTPVAGRNIATARGAAEELLGLGSAKVSAPVSKVSQAVSDALPSKAKEQAKLPLFRGSGDVAAAGFKLDDAGRVIKDKVQQKALKAGVDEGAVAMIASANKATKNRLADMVEVLEKGRGNLEFRNFNPPQRVVGEAIKDRLSIVQNANKQAASKLKDVAKSLQGQSVDVSPAVNVFLDDLGDQGIRFNGKTGELFFDDSTIEGLEGAQNIIKRVVNRLYNTKDPTVDAYRVHNAKRFIDEQVTFGKTQTGLSGQMEGIIKRLRHNLDGVLDRNFKEYDQVNSVYAETRGVLDEVQKLAGPRVDLMGGRVDKALGTMSRKVLSNYNTGVSMEDTFDALELLSKKYSNPLQGGPTDELGKIISMEAELRKMFPSATKPNTFLGESATAARQAAQDIATGNKIGLSARLAEKASKVFSKTDEDKIKAIKDLLAE